MWFASQREQRGRTLAPWCLPPDYLLPLRSVLAATGDRLVRRRPLFDSPVPEGRLRLRWHGRGGHGGWEQGAVVASVFRQRTAERRKPAEASRLY